MTENSRYPKVSKYKPKMTHVKFDNRLTYFEIAFLISKEGEYFFLVHGELIVARDKQIARTSKRFSGDMYVPRYN